MPWFGAHLSIAGGLCNAVEAASRLRMDVFQIFTHSPTRWHVPEAPGSNGRRGRMRPRAKSFVADFLPFAPEEAERFRLAWQKAGMQPPVVHASYLINLASPQPDLWEKSVAAMIAEMHAAAALGAFGVIVHPGSPTTDDETAGMRRVVGAINRILGAAPNNVRLVLETTAGQGASLGRSFEQLAQLINQSSHPQRLAVCFDTAHVFAAGYPLKTTDDCRQTLDRFQRIVGLDRLAVFHLNDSREPLGSRKDRHEHIGRGKIGCAAFRTLVTDPRFSHLPMCLETPKGEEKGVDCDEWNLRLLRQMAKQIVSPKAVPRQRPPLLRTRSTSPRHPTD